MVHYHCVAVGFKTGLRKTLQIPRNDRYIWYFGWVFPTTVSCKISKLEKCLDKQTRTGGLILIPVLKNTDITFVQNTSLIISPRKTRKPSSNPFFLVSYNNQKKTQINGKLKIATCRCVIKTSPTTGIL